MFQTQPQKQRETLTGRKHLPSTPVSDHTLLLSPPSLHTVRVHPALDLALTLSVFSLLLENAIHMTFTFIYCGCCLLMCDSSSCLVSLSWVAFQSGHTWWSTWPRCSFIVCIYDSSSPVLSLNLGQLDVGPLELILPSQPHTLTFPAVESVSYFFTLWGNPLLLIFWIDLVSF